MGLCSRLRWTLSSAPNLLEMFCSVCGWVGAGGWGRESGGFPTSCYIQNIWKGMEKASPSGLVSKDRSRRRCGCDTRGQPALRFLPRTEKTKVSGLRQFVTALHEDSIKAPHFTMYSVSRKFSPLTASPAVVAIHQHRQRSGYNDRVITSTGSYNRFKT